MSAEVLSPPDLLRRLQDEFSIFLARSPGYSLQSVECCAEWPFSGHLGRLSPHPEVRLDIPEQKTTQNVVTC